MASVKARLAPPKASAVKPALTQLLLLAGNRLCRTLAGAGIGVGALTAHRQATTMAQAAIAAQIHQRLMFMLVWRRRSPSTM
jgi:hypothetical protein